MSLPGIKPRSSLIKPSSKAARDSYRDPRTVLSVVSIPEKKKSRRSYSRASEYSSPVKQYQEDVGTRRNPHPQPKRSSMKENWRDVNLEQQNTDLYQSKRSINKSNSPSNDSLLRSTSSAANLLKKPFTAEMAFDLNSKENSIPDRISKEEQS